MWIMLNLAVHPQPCTVHSDQKVQCTSAAIDYWFQKYSLLKSAPLVFQSFTGIAMEELPELPTRHVCTSPTPERGTHVKQCRGQCQGMYHTSNRHSASDGSQRGVISGVIKKPRCCFKQGHCPQRGACLPQCSVLCSVCYRVYLYCICSMIQLCWLSLLCCNDILLV